MAKSALELAVETGKWDAGLKKAKSALDSFTEANGGLQKALSSDSDKMKQFVQMMGRTESTAKTAKGQMNDYKGTIEALTMQYNRMTDAQKSAVGPAYLQAIDQMKQRYKGVADEVAKINQELKQTSTLSDGIQQGGTGGGGLFGGGKLDGMLQVFGGNLMTKGAGMLAGLATEMGDMVKQGIELAKQGEGIRIAFQRLGRGDILDGLRQATHGTVTDLELMKAAVKFNDFKLPLDELGTMLAFAQQKAKDTGQSVDYMVDSIVTGLGRKSLMILDNLGLSAAQIKERMAETGDMTKAVGAIIREQMSKAGDYVETAADRATQANVSLQNKMEELGRKFAPLEEASNNFWTSMKIGILDVVGGPLTNLLNKLTEAGRLMNAYGKIGGNTKVGRMTSNLASASEGNRQSVYQQQQAQFWRYINPREQQIKDIRAWQSGERNEALQKRIGAITEKYGSLDATKIQAEVDAAKKMLAEYQQAARSLLTPVKADVDTTDAGNNVESLTKKLKDLQAERKKAIAAGDTDKSKNLLKQINQVKADIKGLGGTTTTTTTTHQTPQQRAQESFTKAEQNYKQALEQAAMELQAGTITRAEAKKKEMQAAEQRWKAIGDARNINDSDRLRQAQDEAAAEYKRLAAEAKTATEHQKALDKVTRDLENANQKLATARTEMAQAKQQGDLQAYNTAKDKATAAQQEITRLEKVKVDVERGTVDLPDIPKVIEQTVNTHQGELMTADIATEITQKINTVLGNIVKPEILDEVTQTINTKVGNVITPEIAKEVTQVVNVETGTVDLPDIPTTTTTTVDFHADTRNINAAISDVKKEMDTIPVGTIEFNLDQTKLVDLTTLKTLIDEQVKNGLKIDPEATQGLFSKIQLGIDIEDTTWQEVIDKINEKLKELDIKPVSINFKTGDTAKTGKETENAWKNAASAVQSVGSALQQIEDPSAKIAGIIGQAIANIALGFAQATAASSGGGIFAWIAAIAGGMATMISTISAIHSTTGYADGGIVKGNRMSGDQVPAMLNSGELVLNKFQQQVLAANLQAGGLQGLQLEASVHAEQIRLALNNNGKRTGRGELVTWKR